MNTKDYSDDPFREWIGKSRLKAPAGMSERIMNAVKAVPKPAPKHSFGKIWIYFIISIVLLPVSVYFIDKIFRQLAQSLGETGKYFIFYEYALIAVLAGFVLFQTDFFFKNVIEKRHG